MGSFNRGNRSGARQGGRDFGRRDFRGDRGPMHKTICSKCGKECEVPFKPTGSKPVFCRDCFKDNGGRFGEGTSGRPNFDNRNDDRNPQQPLNKDQFVTLHAKLDKILKILTPTTASTEIAQATHLPQIVQEEKIVKTTEDQLSKEQPKISEKKKRASKKTAAIPEE